MEYLFLRSLKRFKIIFETLLLYHYVLLISEIYINVCGRNEK